jgi:hypothetical protein
LAKRNNKTDELIKLYKQHTAITEVYKAIVNTKNFILKELQQLQSQNETTQLQVDRFGRKVNAQVDELNKSMSTLDSVDFIPLPNIDNIAELKEAIIEGGEFKRESRMMFENGGFDRIMQSFDIGINHCQRIDQNSLGKILSFHKDLQN